MTKLARLTKNDDFDICIKNGLKMHTRSFTIFAKKNKLNKTRLGISVSKKVNKSSVVRNLIRRQVKSWFYTHQINLNDDYDLVFIIKNDYDPKKYNFLLNQTLKEFQIKKLI